MRLLHLNVPNTSNEMYLVQLIILRLENIVWSYSHSFACYGLNSSINSKHNHQCKFLCGCLQPRQRIASTIFHDSLLEPRYARLTVRSSYPLSKSSHQRLQLSSNSPLQHLVIFILGLAVVCSLLLLTFMLQAAVQSHVGPSTLNSSAIKQFFSFS